MSVHRMCLRAAAVTVVTLWSTVAPPAVAQIVDRPPTQPQPQSHWGVRASFAPRWSTPDSWGRLLFNVDSNQSPTMEGTDWSIGVVRARPLGFEFGISMTRKTIDQDYIIPDEYSSGFNNEQFVVAVTNTGLENVEITGVESHVVIPAARIGERVLIGALLGGGVGTVPNAKVHKTVEGPPFFASCTNTDASAFVPLMSPPPGGGFVRDNMGGCLRVPPGTRAGTTTTTFRDIWPTEQIWLFIKTQLVVDIQVAGPFKIRVAGGLNFPSAQYIGVEAVYLFSLR
jgi:hypothetical protein